MRRKYHSEQNSSQGMYEKGLTWSDSMRPGGLPDSVCGGDGLSPASTINTLSKLFRQQQGLGRPTLRFRFDEMSDILDHSSRCLGFPFGMAPINDIAYWNTLYYYFLINPQALTKSSHPRKLSTIRKDPPQAK